jgi:hypothetical protein
VQTAGEALAYRQHLVDRIESETSMSLPPPEHRDSPAGGVETSGVHLNDAPPPEEEEESTLEASEEDDDEDERATIADGFEARAPEMSVYDPQEAAPRSRASLVAMVLAGVLLVGGAMLFGLRWMQLQADGDAPPPADSVEPAITIAGGQRSAPVATTATATAQPSASASAVPPRPYVHTRGQAVPDECENPFVIDSRGIRHPKPQCFNKK